MKIKVDCTFDGMRLAKDGEYKLTFVAPLVELSNALSILRGLNKRFVIALVVGGGKNKFEEVALYKISVDKDGETKFILSVPYEQLTQTDLGYFGRCQQANINLFCKIDEADADDEDTDAPDTDEGEDDTDG
jgi:hypothetical protein